MLQQVVHNSVFPVITNATESNEAWTILKQEFQREDYPRPVELQTIPRDFENLYMKTMEYVQKLFLIW